jgi:hypothetical protein
MTFCFHLLGISDALLQLLDTDPAYGVTKTEGRTLAEVEKIVAETDARLTRLDDLYADGRIGADDPRRMAARDQHAAALGEYERITGTRKDTREELYDLAETIRAFWMRTPNLAVALAWLGGNDEKKRELVRRTLSELVIHPDRITFKFRLGLPESIALDRPHLFGRGERLSRAEWDTGLKVSRQAKLDQAAAAAQSP